MKTRFAALLVLAIAWSQVLAQDNYPSRTIRIVVPVPPGGGNDTLSRIVGPKLSDRLHQPVIVDNRPGGNTTLGTAIVAKAAPDGYMLLMAPSAHTVNPVLYSSLSYDPIKDFTAIAGVATTPLLLTAHPSVPVKSLKELVAFAKSRPGQLNYASAGTGTSGHLAGELFKWVAGVQITHVPYKGGGPAMIDLIGGHVSIMFPTIQTAMPYVTAGKLRALAVTSVQQSTLAMSVPTMAQAGLPGVEVGSWFAILGPAGVPANIVAKLDAELKQVLQMADVNERIRGLGYESFYMPPDRLAAFLRSDLAKWTKVIREAGIRADS